MTDLSTPRPRPRGVKPEEAKQLVGQQVVVTAAHEISGWVSEQKTFTGRLIAVGRKFGPSRNTRPYCLVLNCIDTGEGVPIIAVRTVVKIEPVPARPEPVSTRERHAMEGTAGAARTGRHLDLVPDHTPDSTSGDTA